MAGAVLLDGGILAVEALPPFGVCESVKG